MLRIEQDGKGPYCNPREKSHLVTRKVNDWSNRNFDLHTIPQDDSRLVRLALAKGYDLDYSETLDDFIFGFRDIDFLRRWFFDDEILKLLHDDGYVLATYEGESFDGYTQSIMLKESAEKISEESLLDLLNSTR